MRELTHLSLFSGIGGLDLAAEWAGFTSVGQCEWADYPTAILEKHWSDVPRWRDIRTLTKESFYDRTGLRTVDVISGGFPCQPFSVAGMRRGKEDDRYLWPEMLRVIQEIRPTWVVGENVAGIVNMALDTVLSDLEAIGYACQAFIIPACAVDAPHRRDRCAIVAHSMCHGSASGPANPTGGEERQATEFIYSGEALANSDVRTVRDDSKNKWETYRKVNTPYNASLSGGAAGNVCNSTGEGLSYRTEGKVDRPKTLKKPERPMRDVPNSQSGGEQWQFPNWRQARRFSGTRGRTAQPGLGGVADGLSYWLDEPPGVPRTATGIKKRVDRLKCLGNAVVPQQFYPIFKAIADIERSNNGT